MKTLLKTFVAAFWICGTMLLAQGYIVPNGVVMNYGGLFLPTEIDVLHNPANPTNAYSYTGFNLFPEGRTPPTTYTNTFLFVPVADIGVRVFLVSSNDPVSLQPILAGAYTELQYPNTCVFANGVPFYLGLYTGNVQHYPPDGIYTDPLFGWAELVNNRGVIQLLDSALAYQAGGIYAGTQNIIPTPEPGAATLFILGALLFGVRAKHAKSLRHGHPSPACSRRRRM
jgi:hypothetical protein